MAVPTGRESDKFMLRLPDGMRDRIKTAAEANTRSMNAEIVATLEEKYPAPQRDLWTEAIIILQRQIDIGRRVAEIVGELGRTSNSEEARALKQEMTLLTAEFDKLSDQANELIEK